MGIKVDRIILRHIRIPLVHFFETSFGRTFDRDIILVEACMGDVSGWGEVTAGENPFYNEEWTGSILAAADRLHCASDSETRIQRCHRGKRTH